MEAAAAMDVDTPAVVVNDLTFSYGGPDVLKKVGFSLEAGARCLLVGRNGAGKSTLLELLAGSRMGPSGAVRVNGKDPFRVSGLTAHLRGAGPTYAESSVTVLAQSVLDVPDVDVERRERLMKSLEIDPTWNLSRCSASQRLRVRLAVALLKRRSLVLLDEVTAELDLLCREALLEFLKEESASGVVVVICTHNFEGLDGWPTHALHVHDGSVMASVSADELTRGLTLTSGPGSSGVVSQAIQAWLGSIADPSTPQLPALPGTRWPEFEAAFEASELSWTADDVAIVRDISMTMPKQSRCVFVGSAGAGKSSLLSLLAGRRMPSGGSARALGLRAFHDYAKLGSLIALLSDEWKQQVKGLGAGGAMPFSELLSMSIQDLVAKGMDETAVKARAQGLACALEVSMHWTPATASDGQLRRMQLVRALLEPKALLILDEATTDLDLLARQALLNILLEESRAGATVVISTNAFDGLDGWATHIAFMTRNGHLGFNGMVQDVSAPPDASPNGWLHSVAAAWLKADLADPATKRPARGPQQVFAVVGQADPDLPVGWERRTTTVQGAYGDHVWGDKTTGGAPPKKIQEQDGSSATSGAGGHGAANTPHFGSEPFGFGGGNRHSAAAGGYNQFGAADPSPFGAGRHGAAAGGFNQPGLDPSPFGYGNRHDPAAALPQGWGNRHDPGPWS